ncbi:MAG: (2Fe-2S)-binding protein [Rhodospirillaceae bacterium]|nr:(2Fe-2S)-binding protein [Rhodospirillaceae bacterium]
MTKVSVTVNGAARSGEVEPRTLLVEFLRVGLGLTGTHVGCDTSQCGACTVHLNGKPVKSCTMLALQADGQQVTTIEGVAKGDVLHPMQAAFKECHGLQCGFCTPGMVMSALGIVERHKADQLSEAVVRHELEGNLCRCTGYQGIVNAVLMGAKALGVKVV